MSQLSFEEMVERVARLRRKVDSIIEKHQDLLVIQAWGQDPEKVSFDDLVKQCQPKTIGGFTRARIDQEMVTLSLLIASAQNVDDSPSLSSTIPDTLEQGRKIAGELTETARRLLLKEKSLRAEVDALGERAGESLDAGRYAAEQKKLFLEKLILFVAIVILLELAKACLLQVIDLLEKAANLRGLIAKGLSLLATDLNNVARDIILNSKPIPNKLIPAVTDGFQITNIQKANLFAASQKMREALSKSSESMKVADAFFANAQQLLVDCIALQALAQLIEKILEASQVGVFDEEQMPKEPF